MTDTSAKVSAEAPALDDRSVQEEDDENLTVYTRRFFVLGSYALSMFAWNLSSYRAVAIVPSYAMYFNTTNELSSPPEYGIDSLTVVSSLMLVFTYFLGAYAVDRWGLKVMILGSFGVAVSNWLWVLAGQNILLALLCRCLSTVFGPMVSSALLAISNRWFAPKERAKATALGSLVNILGAGVALVMGPMFKTQSEEIVEFDLKSCMIDSLTDATKSAFAAAKLNGTALECIDDHLYAKDFFCCYLPVDIKSLDLTMAVIPTVMFLITAASVRDLPPTPPSYSAEPKDFVGLITGLKMMFSNQRFAKLALSDFICSGPPLVLYSTLSRIFPSEIAKYNTLASAIGLAIAVPIAVVIGHYLDKHRAYWTFTMGGYTAGTTFWILGMIAFATATTAGNWIFLGMVVLAIGAYVVWQTAVYETKLEYIFSHRINLEGYIVGADRVVINLSSFVFVAAIPPERVGGALNTFYIGAAIMVIGLIPTALIRDKYRYLRLAYDQEMSKRKDPEANM